MSRSDVELWTAILADEQTAWAELVERYKALVYAACSYTGLSQSDSKDVFQQTWLQLYQHRRNLTDPTRISAWLVTTARREAIHLRKKNKTHCSDVSIADTADPKPGPEEELLILERQMQLEIALRELDTPCRTLLTAFFFESEEMKYHEIAVSLGYAPNTLGAKRRRCLDRLRKILQKMGYLAERKTDRPPLL